MNLNKIFDESDALTPAWQRGCDIVIAGIALCMASPIFIVVALAIRLTMGSPVFFRQIRPGLLGRNIMIVKFRTMRVDRVAIEAASPDASRITRLGAFLRRSSLDELPELWGVVCGDLSMVGPRPLLPEYLPYYTDRELIRCLVRPGLTGLAQVSGRNMIDWDVRLEMDVKFAEGLSPQLYFSILWRTIFSVLSSSGVSVDPYAVAKPLHIERSKKRQ